MASCLGKRPGSYFGEIEWHSISPKIFQITFQNISDDLSNQFERFQVPDRGIIPAAARVIGASFRVLQH
jgi:hypothetical protein